MKIEKNTTAIMGNRKSFFFKFRFDIRPSSVTDISNPLQIKK